MFFVHIAHIACSDLICKKWIKLNKYAYLIRVKSVIPGPNAHTLSWHGRLSAFDIVSDNENDFNQLTCLLWEQFCHFVEQLFELSFFL
jgi:hypothetical protein